MRNHFIKRIVLFAGISILTILFSFQFTTGTSASLITSYASEIEETDMANFTWEECSDGISITGLSDSGKGLTEIVIPSAINNLPVVEIGNSAFSQERLTHVTLPDGLLRIESAAFMLCPLVEINFPDSLLTIESYAFYYTPLRSVELPTSIELIEPVSFLGCNSLESFILPSDNPHYTVENGILYNKNKTVLIFVTPAYPNSTLILPDTVETISSRGVSDILTLKEITLNEGLKEIQSEAFSGTPITTLHIPASVTNLSSYSFSYALCLETFSVDKNNKNYSSYNNMLLDKSRTTLISYCSNSNSPLTIPNTVTAIASGALNARNMKSVTIPYTVTSIGKNLCNGDVTLFVNKGSFAETYAIENNYPYEIYPDSILESPEKPYKITNVVNGVHVYWDSVDGAVKYGVWRSETGKNGTYKWIANPTVPHFTDTKVESGVTYHYKISAMNFDGIHSEKSPSIGIAFVSTPDISTRANTTEGIKLGWEKISGASGYAIYRKSYDGTDAWKRIATIKNNDTFSWVDTSVAKENGTSYRYTIRALIGTNFETLSGCRNTGRTMLRLTTRVITDLSATSSTSIKVTWSTTSIADGYEMFFIDSTGNKHTIKVTDPSVGTRTFSDISPNSTYTINIRSYKHLDNVGTFYSAWSEEKTVSTSDNTVATPAKPYKITNVVSGVHVYWKALDGIEKYGLWRSEDGISGDYKWIANPTVPHFTDTSVESGKTYYYKVTSLDSQTGIHGEKSEAINITFVSTPDITQRNNTENGISLGWEKIDGAQGYAIYRKSFDSSDSWQRITTIENNETFTWTDTSVADDDGIAYRYTIRALVGNKLSVLSGCRSTGRTMIRLTMQDIYSTSTTANSITYSWTTSTNITGYEIRLTDIFGNTKTQKITSPAEETATIKYLKDLTAYNAEIRTYKTIPEIGTFYSDWSPTDSARTLPTTYAKYKSYWDIILNDESQWGAWDLTYLEFIDMYRSIGTENDLLIATLKEKGTRHGLTMETDRVQGLEFSFDNIETAKMYALSYAPFEYSSEDLESGNFGKDMEEAFLDHGGVCGILASVYEIFIRDILQEHSWKYCYYANEQANHAVLLVMLTDGTVVQIDNTGVASWWTGMVVAPDYSKIGDVDEDPYIISRFEDWKAEYKTLEQAFWHTYCFSYYNEQEDEYKYRPIWYNYDTGEFEAYLGNDIPMYYTVSCVGLPGKIISMAGWINFEIYDNLSDLTFK